MRFNRFDVPQSIAYNFLFLDSSSNHFLKTIGCQTLDIIVKVILNDVKKRLLYHLNFARFSVLLHLHHYYESIVVEGQ